VLNEISVSLALRDSSLAGGFNPESSTLKLTCRSWVGLALSFTSVFAADTATEAGTDTEDALAVYELFYAERFSGSSLTVFYRATSCISDLRA
jgi:hypothetical protein